MAKKKFSKAAGRAAGTLAEAFALMMALVIGLVLAGCEDPNKAPEGGGDKTFTFTLKGDEQFTVAGYRVQITTGGSSDNYFPGPTNSEWADLSPAVGNGETSGTLEPFTAPNVNGGYAFEIEAKLFNTNGNFFGSFGQYFVADVKSSYALVPGGSTTSMGRIRLVEAN